MAKLLPLQVADLAKIIPELFRRQRPLKAVTMAKAWLNNGQSLYAVNDLFIGPKSHGSARYTIKVGSQTERHSSSGVIVSTGLGSTGGGIFSLSQTGNDLILNFTPVPEPSSYALLLAGLTCAALGLRRRK